MAFRLVRQLSQEQKELVKEVSEGKISPDDAEAESIGMGFGPIAEELDYKRYNVGNMPTWTLPMSIAWVLWRNIERVTMFHDPYRENNFHWEAFKIVAPRKMTLGASPLPTVVKRAYNLKRLQPASFSSLAILPISDGIRDIPLRCRGPGEAKALLWDKLISGEIIATGLDAVTGEFKHVEPRQWTYFDFGRHAHAHQLVDVYGNLKIVEVRLLRADVQSLWQKDDAAPAEPATVIPKGKRGPKLKYDSETYIAEVIDFLEDNGGIAPARDPGFTRTTIAEHMENWCKKRWEVKPGDTWQKKRIRLAIERYEQGNGR